jgi:hypothetical protein
MEHGLHRFYGQALVSGYHPNQENLEIPRIMVQILRR